MKFKEKISKKFNKIKKKSRKMLSLGLASFLVCNSIADIGLVFADEISSRSTISVGQVGNSLSYIGDRSGNFLKFPKKEVKGTRQEAFCLEHNKTTPSSSGMTYTEGGALDSGLAYIMNYKPNTGNSDKDYYIKQTAIHYYLGQINWIQYATTGTDIRDKAVALANEAKNREVKSNVSITASPRQQDFKLVGDNYETDWFNVSIQGNLTSYRMDIKGAPNGTQIINASGNVVTSLTQNDTNFKLRVPKLNVNGNYEIKIRLQGQFLKNIAIEYLPSNSGYQKIALLKQDNVNEYDKSFLTVNLVGNGTVEVTKKSENGSVLSGAGFKLVKDGKDATSVKETGADGKVTFSDLVPGTYEVVETKAPAGHVLSTTKQTVTVTAGNTAKVEVSNEVIKGKIKVLKIDEETNEPLKGAEFELKEKATGKVVEKLVTGEDGTVISGLHPFGEYVLQETKAPDKYTLNGQEYFVTISEHMKTIEVTAKNRIIKGQIAVNKLDSELKEDLPLEGAEFTIYDLENKEVDTLITNQDGYAISKEINHGSYTMKETKAPEGYKLSDEIYKIEISEDGKVYTYDVTNDVKKGKIEVNKTDSETNRALKGAEFTIYDLHRNEIDKLITDENGYAISKEIRHGRYVLQETKAPEGYKLSDEIYKIDIKEDGKVYTYDITNDVKKGDLEFSKTDVATGEIVEGATIEIVGLDETNNHIKFDFISSKDDKFKLPVGKYEFKETIAPDGYVLNEEVGTFEIKEDGEVVKAELKNKKIEGTLLFEKTDVSTGKVIDGAHIKIECIEGFDNGKVIEFVSSKDGNKFPLLYGKYRITETIAPNGYIKTDEVGEFEITEDGQIVKAQLKNQRMVIKTENPKTGDKGIAIPAVIAISSLVGLVGIGIYNRSQYEYYYEDEEEEYDE